MRFKSWFSASRSPSDVQQAAQSTSKLRGDAAESAALTYLLEQGLTLLSRNYRCKLGEIDLIMQHQNVLVFVEVRMRKSNQFGTAIETVTTAKQNKIIRAAQIYLMNNSLSENTAMRFDVIGMNGRELQWIKAAF